MYAVTIRRVVVRSEPRGREILIWYAVLWGFSADVNGEPVYGPPAKMSESFSRRKPAEQIAQHWVRQYDAHYIGVHGSINGLGVETV